MYSMNLTLSRPLYLDYCTATKTMITHVLPTVYKQRERPATRVGSHEALVPYDSLHCNSDGKHWITPPSRSCRCRIVTYIFHRPFSPLTSEGYSIVGLSVEHSWTTITGSIRYRYGIMPSRFSGVRNYQARCHHLLKTADRATYYDHVCCATLCSMHLMVDLSTERTRAKAVER